MNATYTAKPQPVAEPARVDGILLDGKRLVQRHQIVYRALGDRMREEIHALSMQTYTPEDYARK